MIEFQPHAEEQLRVFDRFVADDGKTTLNPEEYKKFREEKAVEAEKNKKIASAAKAAKTQIDGGAAAANNYIG